MFVGYQENHYGDCYRMCYPTTNKILLTRDVIWLHRMYFKKRAPKVKMIKTSTKSKVGKGVRELDLAMCVSPSSNGSKMRSLWTNQMKS